MEYIPDYFYPPLETAEESQGNETLIQYYGWRPPGWSSVVDWKPGDIAGSAWDGAGGALEGATGWHPGEFAGQASRGIGDSVKGVFGGIGDVFQETAQTAQLMMFAPMIIIGALLVVVMLVVVVKISKPKKKEDSE